MVHCHPINRLYHSTNRLQTCVWQREPAAFTKTCPVVSQVVGADAEVPFAPITTAFESKPLELIAIAHIEVAVLGFFIAGVLNAVVNKAAVARHLGGNIMGATALAATWGFLMPLCCCSGIPTALTLYRSGSRRGPACAFLIAVPWFNWYGLTALVVFLGWWAGVIVSLSAVTVGFVAGVLIETVAGQSPRVPAIPVLAVTGGCADAGRAGRSGDAGCCDTGVPGPAHQPLLDLSNPKDKVRSGAWFAVDLLREIGPWMMAGILVGAAIEAAVPKGLVTTYLGKASLAGVLMTLVIAGAFYTDSLASLPWVRTLLDKGLGAGSGMILLVAGVGTNLSTPRSVPWPGSWDCERRSSTRRAWWC